MHYWAIYIFSSIVVVNWSFTEADPLRNQVTPLNSNSQPYDDNSILVIGNGVHSNHRVVIGDAPSVFLNNRFSDDSIATADPQPVPRIDNPNQNVFTQNTKSNGFNNGGTSFVHNSNNRLGLFNVGHGSNNRNKVVIGDIPIQWDQRGSQPSASSEIEDQLRLLRNLTLQLQGIITQLIEDQHSCIPQESGGT